MSSYKVRILLSWVALAGLVQFIVLTTIAMFYFPGGTHADPATTGYDFFRNFFSDLGGTVTPGGSPNPVSSVLFFIALFLSGALFIPLDVTLPLLFKEKKWTFVVAIIGSIIGAWVSICLIGVAFTPWNVHFVLHYTFVLWGFPMFLPAALLYAVAILGTKKYKWYHAVPPMVFAAISLGYIFLLFSGPSMGSIQDAIAIHAAGQKIIVYAAIITFSLLALGSAVAVKRESKSEIA